MLKSHNQTIFETLGRHPIHPFPARMAPGIALDALGESAGQLRVLDPMMGSGTVLAVARSKGHRAWGVDVDPLAVLLARVWTRTTEPKIVRDCAAQVLARAKQNFAKLAVRDAYPSSDDEETRAFVRYWFDDYARRQLAALASAIRDVEHKPLQEVLWCGFSRLIITKQAGASLAMDLAHSRPHKAFLRAPTKPFSKFAAAVEMVAANCPHAGGERVGPPCDVRQGDARCLPVDDASIDIALTSPPYLNAIDYLRCSKFSLVWMGHTIGELRKIRSDSVGSEASSDEAMKDKAAAQVVEELGLRPKLSTRHHGLLMRYVSDMKRAVGEVARVLRPSGVVVYVVGDSTVRGTFIQNSSVVRAVSEMSGLRLKERHARDLPANRRYLPPPKRTSKDDTMGSRMRQEIVLVFEKTASQGLG